MKNIPDIESTAHLLHLAPVTTMLRTDSGQMVICLAYVHHPEHRGLGGFDRLGRLHVIGVNGCRAIG